jgi:AcrR family transcriptional regulator
MAEMTERRTGRDRRAPVDARAALIAAGTELFAELGPDAVSLRTVAQRAGVNYGLVHRHFGTKEALLKAVTEPQLTGLKADLAALPPGPPELVLGRVLAAVQKREAYWRLLARAMLAGQDPHEVQSDFPAAEWLMRWLSTPDGRSRLADGVDQRQVLALIMATGLGWMVFEPFLRAVSGLDERGTDPVQQAPLIGLVARILGTLTAPPPKD